MMTLFQIRIRCYQWLTGALVLHGIAVLLALQQGDLAADTWPVLIATAFAWLLGLASTLFLWGSWLNVAVVAMFSWIPGPGLIIAALLWAIARRTLRREGFSFHWFTARAPSSSSEVEDDLDKPVNSIRASGSSSLARSPNLNPADLDSAQRKLLTMALKLGADWGIDAPVLLMPTARCDTSNGKRSRAIGLYEPMARELAYRWLQQNSTSVHAFMIPIEDSQLAELALVLQPDYRKALIAIGLKQKQLVDLLEGMQNTARVIGFGEGRLTLAVARPERVAEMMRLPMVRDSDNFLALGERALRARLERIGYLDLQFSESTEPVPEHLPDGRVAIAEVGQRVQRMQRARAAEDRAQPKLPVPVLRGGYGKHNGEDMALLVFPELDPDLAEYLAGNIRFMPNFPSPNNIREPWVIFTRSAFTGSPKLDLVVSRCEVGPHEVIAMLGIDLPGLGLSHAAITQWIGRLAPHANPTLVVGGGPQQLNIELGRVSPSGLGEEGLEREFKRYAHGVLPPEEDRYHYVLTWQADQIGEEPSASFDTACFELVEAHLWHQYQQRGRSALEFRSRASINQRGSPAKPMRAVAVARDMVWSLWERAQAKGMVVFSPIDHELGPHSGLGKCEVVVLAGSDVLEPVRLMETCGPELSNTRLLAFLAQLRQRIVFHIVEAGRQRIALIFPRVPTQVDGLIAALMKLSPISAQFFGPDVIRWMLKSGSVTLEFEASLAYVDVLTPPPEGTNFYGEQRHFIQVLGQSVAQDGSTPPKAQDPGLLHPMLGERTRLPYRRLSAFSRARFVNFLVERWEELNVASDDAYPHALGPYTFMAMEPDALERGKDVDVVLLHEPIDEVFRAVGLSGKGLDRHKLFQSLERIYDSFGGHFDYVGIGPKSLELLVHYQINSEWTELVHQNCPNLANLSEEQLTEKVAANQSVLHLWWD